MHTVSKQWISLLSYVHVYRHTWLCTYPTHSHTLIWIQTLKDSFNNTCIKTHLYHHTQAWINTHAYTCTHAFMHLYSRTHVNTCTHTYTHLHSRTSIYTHVRANANMYRCIKTKMHSQTICTYTHKYTYTLTQAHEHASAHKTYRLTYTSILWCIHIYVCERTPINNTYQHIRTHTDMQTCMHSITHVHAYTLESVYKNKVL